MFVIVYWLKLASEKVVPESVTAKTPLSDNNVVCMSTHTSHQNPCNELFVIYTLNVLANASNNNYPNDLLVFCLYCITFCCLNCLCSFPVWCLGKAVGFDCIGSWSSLSHLLWFYYMIPLVFILVAILNFDNFKMWHTGTMYHQNVNIRLVIKHGRCG